MRFLLEFLCKSVTCHVRNRLPFDQRADCLLLKHQKPLKFPTQWKTSASCEKSGAKTLSFQEVVEKWLMVDGNYIHMLAEPDPRALCLCCVVLFLCLVLRGTFTWQRQGEQSVCLMGYAQETPAFTWTNVAGGVHSLSYTTCHTHTHT